jgi:hypothetical protein
MTLSTQNLASLPAIEPLRRLMQSLAMLDAILQPDWEYRYYSFNRKWSEGQQMASMRNGEGDEWFCVFSGTGAFLKGFDHESEMSPFAAYPPSVWPGVLEALPPAFLPFVREPAFSMDATTFCIWRAEKDEKWQAGSIAYPQGPDPDGSRWMLALLAGDPEAYRAWAEDYHGRPVDAEAVRRVYRHENLSAELIRLLNPERTLEDLAKDIEEIGYPSALG